MSRLLCPIVFLLASCTAFSAAVVRSSAGGTVELAIDGVSCGRVISFEGGDPRASGVTEKPAGTALPKKHVAGISYAPITVEVTFPPAQPILNWIGDLCANRNPRKTLLFREYDLSGLPAGVSLQATSALLTEVRFPGFDASSKEAARLTLVFAPESTQASSSTSASPAATVAGAAGKAALLANYRIQIGSLPTGGVSRIEPFTIKQSIGGSVGEYEKDPGTTEFSNLVLTLNSTDLADWTAWRDDFVVKGANGDASERSGSLQVLAANMTPLLTLQFSHVGILRVSPDKIQAGSDAARKFQAELYYESMIPGTATAGATTAGAAAGAAAAGATGGGAAGGAAATAEDASAGAASGAGAGAGSAAAGGAAGSAGAAAASGSSSGSVKGTTEAAAGGAAAGGAAAGGGAAGAASDATSPSGGVAGRAPATKDAPAAVVASAPSVATSGDLGARDPKDFPRPVGSVRKSFSSVRQATYTQEIVAYSSKDTLDALEEFYTKSLTAAGWELGVRVENDGSVENRHQIILNWKNALRSVAITLADLKAGGAGIGVNLTTKVAP